MNQSLSQITTVGLYTNVEASFIFGFALESPIQAVNALIDSIIENPDIYREAIKEERKRNRGKCDVKNLLGVVPPNERKRDSRGGTIGILALTTGNIAEVDGTYFPRGDIYQTPEFAPSPMLGELTPKMDLIQARGYGSVNYFIKKLIQYRNVAVTERKKMYNALGQKQREFIATLDDIFIHSLDQNGLAGEIGIPTSNVSRLIKGRSVEINHGQETIEIPTRFLLATEDDVGYYACRPEINNSLKEEFETGIPISDQKIANRVREARRTVNKHRSEAGIPSSYQRLKDYAAGLNTHYRIPSLVEMKGKRV